jgi:hypothetical protein
MELESGRPVPAFEFIPLSVEVGTQTHLGPNPSGEILAKLTVRGENRKR